MFRNLQLKLILIYFVIGMLLISGLGAVLIFKLTHVDLMQNITNLLMQTKLLILASIALFGIITLSFSIYIYKKIIYPMTRMIEGARTWQKFGTGEESEIKTILLYMSDGIIVFDIKGRIKLINPAAKKLLSIRPEDITFDDIFKKFKLDINMEKIIYLENWTSTEQRIEVEGKYTNVSFAPYKNKQERPDGVIVVAQDITEHVKLDNMRKEFVADVSHELKTPITSIMGYADTLLEGEYDKQTQDKFLNVIATEARRMAKLVTDLLTLSRYDNNRNKTQKEQFNLGDLVKKCQDKLAIEIKKKGHKVDCFVTADVPPVYSDKYDIERVILNILSNSIKYTPDNGEIKIYVGFVYNDAYIKIIDNGIGIPEEDLSRIFERFYRVDKARTRELGGTGLGLSIAKEILDKNAGSIDIKSIVGEGTEVVIRIPTKQ